MKCIKCKNWDKKHKECIALIDVDESLSPNEDIYCAEVDGEDEEE